MDISLSKVLNAQYAKAAWLFLLKHNFITSIKRQKLYEKIRNAFSHDVDFYSWIINTFLYDACKVNA